MTIRKTIINLNIRNYLTVERMQVKIEHEIGQDRVMASFSRTLHKDLKPTKVEDGEAINIHQSSRANMKSQRRLRRSGVLNTKGRHKLDRRIINRISQKIFKNITSLDAKHIASNQQKAQQAVENEEQIYDPCRKSTKQLKDILNTERLLPLIDIKLSQAVLKWVAEYIIRYKKKMVTRKKTKQSRTSSECAQNSVKELLDYEVSLKQMTEAIILSWQIDLHPFYASLWPQQNSDLVTLNAFADTEPHDKLLSNEIKPKDHYGCLPDRQMLNSHCACSQDLPIELPIKVEQNLMMSFEHSPNEWTGTESRDHQE